MKAGRKGNWKADLKAVKKDVLTVGLWVETMVLSWVDWLEYVKAEN